MLHMWFLAAIVGVTAPLVEQIPTPPSLHEEIIVTAALEDGVPSELPVSVTTIGAPEIRRRQATDVLQLLRTVPGLAVAQSGSPGKVGSVFMRGAQSSQTLVLWNGLRLNDPYFGGFDWAFLSTDGVERIEVVRGPASALYGSDAIGGVVQVLGGRGIGGGTARIEAGEDAYGRLGLAWGGDFGRARVDVAGHARTGEGGAANDFYDGEEARLKLDWTVGSQASVGLFARAGRSEVGIPVASGTLTPRRRQESDTVQIGVPFEARWGKWRLEGALAQVESDLVFSDPDAVFSRSDTDAERLRMRSVATYRAEDGAWLAIGADWEREEVTSSSNFGPALTSESRRTSAVFAQAQKAWGALRFDLGVRSDHDEFYGSALSPRAGVVADLPRRVQLFASYGEGFRAPSLGELFFPFYGNPDLAPEESASGEIGVRRQGERWSVAAAGFATDLENLIETNPLTFTAVNVGRAEIRGAELEVGYRHGIVDARASLTLLDTEDLSSGEQLLRRPSESVALVLTVSPEAFTSTLTTRWVGERFDIDPVTFERRLNEDHFVADIALTWQASPRLAPYARVENLADRKYEEVLGFAALGRTVIVGLEVGIQ